MTTNQPTQYMGGIGYSPIVLPNSQPAFNFSFKNVNWNDFKNDYRKQQNWNNGLQAGAMVANTGMGITQMALNFSVQKEYYKSVREAMKNQLTLGLASVDLEMDRNKTMKDINEDNNKTAIKVSKLQANAQVKIASVNQRGLTDRAKVFAAYNAFSRRQPFYGLTA